MFDSRTIFAARLADAADLLIDFATLGEYGLEPGGRLDTPCEPRRRGPARQGTRPRGAGRRRQDVAVRGA
jgi:hypothetical protein